MTRPIRHARGPGDDAAADADARFLHSQRLETLGILAAQVAHDLNNVLVSILGDAALLVEELAPGDPVRERVAGIAAAGRDARALVRQLLSLAGASSQPVAADPNLLVDDALLMFRAIAPPDIAIEWQPNGQVGPVTVDAVQVRQALLNLLVNAAAAISREGSVHVRVAPVDGGALGSAPFVTRARPVRGRRYVSFSVRDTGAGMTPEVLARAFEPFFTTRSEGTGLGLPAVLAAVTRHEGLVAAESSPGRGTTVALYFPAAGARR